MEEAGRFLQFCLLPTQINNCRLKLVHFNHTVLVVSRDHPEKEQPTSVVPFAFEPKTLFEQALAEHARVTAINKPFKSSSSNYLLVVIRTSDRLLAPLLRSYPATRLAGLDSPLISALGRYSSWNIV